jgi:hypothetical protein
MPNIGKEKKYGNSITVLNTEIDKRKNNQEGGRVTEDSLMISCSKG